LGNLSGKDQGLKMPQLDCGDLQQFNFKQQIGTKFSVTELTKILHINASTTNIHKYRDFTLVQPWLGFKS